MNRSLPPTPGVEIDADATGGAPSFERFYAEAWLPAFRLASFLTQSTAAGEEIAQEALLGLYRRWESVDRPEAYLRRALVNGAGNWRRHETVKQAKLPLLAGADRFDFAADELADALATLPFRQRAVLVLRYQADLSEAEIAETLGCRPGTVKSLASRALARLAREIPR